MINQDNYNYREIIAQDNGWHQSSNEPNFVQSVVNEGFMPSDLVPEMPDWFNDVPLPEHDFSSYPSDDWESSEEPSEEDLHKYYNNKPQTVTSSSPATNAAKNCSNVVPLVVSQEKSIPNNLTYEYQDFVGPQIVDHLLARGNAFIINPDTGHGKTTAIENSKQCTVLAMPMQAQCKQRQAKGASFAVYQEVSVKDVPDVWRNIATTYNSLPRVMSAHFPDLLAIDEIHHFLTDSYRQGAIRDAYRVIQDFDGPKILMSATPLANILTSTIFPSFQVVDCRDVGTARPIRQIPIIAIDGGTVDQALRIARTGMVNNAPFPIDGVIICHVNDKTEIKASINYINITLGNVGKAYGFTANTKELAYHEMMIRDGVLPTDCRFIFTTSLINDGFSFGPRANVVLVSRQSALLPHEVVQLCARWRDGLDMALPLAVLIFKRESDKKKKKKTSEKEGEETNEKKMNLSHKGPIFEQAVINEYERLFEIAKRNLECAIAQREILNKRLNACADQGETKQVSKLIEKINAAYTDLIFRKDSIEIDRIAILQKAVEANRHMTTGQLIREIEEYGGFYFAGSDKGVSDEAKNVKEAKEVLKAENKEDKAEQFANVLKVSKAKGVELSKDILDSLKEYPDIYPDGTIEGCRAVVSLWRVVEKEGGDFNKLLDAMAEYEVTSKNKADKLAGRIRTAQIMTNRKPLADLANDGHTSAKAIQELGKLVPSGTLLTKEKLKEISQAMQKVEGSSMIGRWDDEAKTQKSIKARFECKRDKAKENGKRVNVWRVDGVFDLSVICNKPESEKPVNEKVRHQQAHVSELL